MEARMPSNEELEAKFWKALESDRTMMLGLDGVEDGHTRPMTAQTEGPTGPIWFFSGRDNSLVQALRENLQALLADLQKAKPSAAKGVYMKRVAVSSTMGPGVQVDLSSLGA
jgi:general stress protein 26